MKLSTLASLWDQFFFAKVSPYPVAVFRILNGFMLLQLALSLGPDLIAWYGKNGLVRQVTMYSDNYNRFNLVSFFPDSEPWLWFLYSILLLGSICLIIGFKSRLSALLCFLVLASLFNRNSFLLNAGDTFLRSMTYWMIFASSGAVWSVDSYLSNREKQRPPYCPLVSAWPQRAMQFQICFVYFSAFSAKTPGWYWGTGEAVYIASRFETLQRLPMPFPMDIMLISQFFTWGTLIVEFLLFTAIWIKDFRYYVLAMGVCMHLTIDWMMAIPQFEWLMILSYILWIDPVHINRAVQYSKMAMLKLKLVQPEPKQKLEQI